MFRDYFNRPAFPVRVRTNFLSRFSNRYSRPVPLMSQETEEDPPIGYESSWAGIYPEHKE